MNQRRVNISLKRKVNIDSWDKSKGNSQEVRIINGYIDKINSELFQAYQDLKSERKVIKSRFLGLDEQHYFLQDIIDYHNENTANKLHKGTLGLYKTP